MDEEESRIGEEGEDIARQKIKMRAEGPHFA
jgi:hypothetical protein